MLRNQKNLKESEEAIGGLKNPKKYQKTHILLSKVEFNFHENSNKHNI